MKNFKQGSEVIGFKILRGHSGCYVENRLLEGRLGGHCSSREKMMAGT